MKKSEVYKILDQAYFGPKRHEDEELRLLPKLLNRCEIFVDVGASLGQYTKAASEALKGKKIISIEADPIRFERLTQNAILWEQNGNENEISVLNCAAGNSDGSVEFFTNNTNVSGSLTPITGRVSSNKSVIVGIKKIDSLFKSNQENVVVKIDVEGSEYRVLKGMDKLLRNVNIEVLVELHSWGDQNTKKYPHHVLSYLKDLGFFCYKTHAHFYFAKSQKEFKQHNYSFEIAKWWAKHVLRKVPLVRWFKVKVFG